jgi:hypothetical protein
MSFIRLRPTNDPLIDICEGCGALAAACGID